jgi:hypothetical protein
MGVFVGTFICNNILIQHLGAGLKKELRVNIFVSELCGFTGLVILLNNLCITCRQVLRKPNDPRMS